jgi:hypothetical protein
MAIELIHLVLNLLTVDTSFRTTPRMFDKIIGYEGIKRTFVRSLTSKEPVHILLVRPAGHAKTLFLFLPIAWPATNAHVYWGYGMGYQGQGMAWQKDSLYSARRRFQG